MKIFSFTINIFTYISHYPNVNIVFIFNDLFFINSKYLIKKNLFGCMKLELESKFYVNLCYKYKYAKVKQINK